MYSSKKFNRVSFIALTLAFSLSMSFTQQAFAFVPAAEMKDLSSNHWAYKAIKGLVEKYEVMSGFPDKNFKGSRAMSRYELAAALYKVMSKVEELIATATKNAVSETMDYETQKSSVSKEDLETLMILQKEFKTEIEQVKTRMTKLEDKVDTLGKVKIGGKVEVKYRDRMFVTDPTNTNSPLNGTNFDVDGDKGLTKFNDAARNLITEFDRTPFRIKTTFDIDASLAKGLDFHGSFIADDGTIFKLGNVNGQAVGGHFLDEGLTGNSIYPALSMIRAKAFFDDLSDENNKKSSIGVSLGFMNFGKVFKTGTKFKNHFSSEKWVGHGYGLLGFGMDEKAVRFTTSKSSSGVDTVTKNSVSRFWATGIDVSTVDPDSSRFNNVPSPSLMFDASLGPISLAFGGNAGSPYVNRYTALLGNLGLGDVPNLDKSQSLSRPESSAEILTGQNFVGDSGGGLVNEKVIIGSKDPYSPRTSYNLIPLPSEYGDGYGMAGLDLDLGWLRCALSASDYWLDSTFSLSGTRKSISGVVDIGSDLMGLTLQSNYYALGLDSYSIGFFANDLAKTGIDIGVGAKTAMRGVFGFGQIVRPNLGFYVALPSFSDSIPKITFAARQTMGDGFGSQKDFAGNELTKVNLLKDSGITIGTTFEHVAGSDFNIDVEYNGLVEGALWGFNFMAHDIGIFTTYNF